MGKIECIYNFINYEYGQRGAWISDIAIKLGISKEQANMLTIAAGYVRGKKVNLCTLETFGDNENVRLVVSYISNDKMKDLSEAIVNE